MKKGSLTIFFSMIISVVMIFIFTMTELIRIYELKAIADEYASLAVESAFSEYNQFLWDNYRILAIDLGYGSNTTGPAVLESRLKDYANDTANPDYGESLTREKVISVEAKNYTLLTDNGGQAVISQGIKAVSAGLIDQIVNENTKNASDLESVNDVDLDNIISSGSSSLSAAKAELAEKKRAASEDDDPDTNPEDYPEPGTVEDDPLTAITALKNSFSKGIIESVIPDAANISSEAINLASMPSKRSCFTGTTEAQNSNSIIDKALFIEYLMTNYQYYGKDLDHPGLSHEIEYLITGKDSDTNCLASVVTRLLLAREAANYMTILSNESMKIQAAGIAEILAGFTGNPAIIEAVKYAIIGVWAYTESVLDVRCILSGGKIPIVKTQSQWTSEVYHLSSYIDVSKKAKTCETGLSYRNYLMTFLALENIETISMRCCDVMENALHTQEDYSLVQIDNMLCSLDAKFTFTSREIFLTLLSDSKDLSEYTIIKNSSLAY